MIQRSKIDNVFGMLAPYAGGSIFSLPESEIIESGGLVLSCQRYSDESYRAIKALNSSGFDTVKVGAAYDVSMPGRFARTRVGDSLQGVPFLTGSSMQALRPEKDDFISKILTPDLDAVLLKEGTVVITRSGTVGNSTYVTGDYVGCAGTDDLIRVNAKDTLYSNEYFYMFSISALGRALVTKDIYGGVIDHIEPDHLMAVSIPVLPRRLREKISILARQCAEARATANKVLDTAEASVQKSNGLPDLQGLHRESFLSEVGWGTSFKVRASVFNTPHELGQLRLDATYQEPTVVALREFILRGETGTKVSALVKGIFRSSLRARNYVDDKDAGVPMIGGKQLTQIRPTEIKYLSKTLTPQLATERINAGVTLVTCGGTVGRTLFVHRNYEQWIASEHIMKLVPDADLIAPGYLYAFLASPYGQIQVKALMHGSVIPQIRDFEFGSIAISLPRDRGATIHDLVVEAFDFRAEAKALEDEAMDLFMTAIDRGRVATEQEWCREY